MARFNPKRDIAPLLEAAQTWIRRCLIGQASLFSDKALWTPDVLRQVRAAFTDNPDASDASFFQKLAGQMGSASPEAKQLMAELLWVLMLFQSNILPATKRESIGKVWGWSGDALDLRHPLLADAVLTGVGSPGTAYNTQRWRELNYVIGLATDLAQRPLAEREGILTDRDRFEAWIAHAPAEGYRQFRHLFRYLAFPDHNERITLGRDRRLILEAYEGLSPQAIAALTDAQKDDALAALRERLKRENGLEHLDFYQPEFTTRWRGDAGGASTLGGDETTIAAGFEELKKKFLRRYPDFKTFESHVGFASDERAYKDELVDAFRDTVEGPLQRGDWKAAGSAAVELLRRPLRAEGGKPQNIVGWRFIDLVRRLDERQLELLGQALSALTDESVDLRARVERFVGQLQQLVGATMRVLPAAQRSITGFYLTLRHPDRHLFMKTAELRTSLGVLDPSFRWNSGALTGQDVERVESLARGVQDLLEAEGWEPRDLIDVQSFLWQATNEDKRVREADEEEAEMAETPVVATQARVPLNQILFGPPGTGKTFHTVTKALEILDPQLLANHPGDRRRHKLRFDELVASRRIRVVTFHQSFAYEDFVEGIRADSDEEEKLRYRVEPGVFRRICDDARGSARVASAIGIRDDARIWKLSIDGTGPSGTRDYCLAHGEARIGWGEAGDLRSDRLSDNEYYRSLGSHNHNTLHMFANEMEPGDVVLCIRSAKEVQAIGVVQDDYSYQVNVPPGLHSDYNNLRHVRWLAQGLSLDLRALNGGTRFTLKTVYEITRFGWPELAEVIEAAGIKLQGSPQAQQLDPLDHVLIIDEINRGNVSRIFGELITLIEKSKRHGEDEQLEVMLPYSRKPFTVPRNVYLIGTMNTADRSLAGLDTALRRRFEFVEMPPDPTALRDIVVEGVHIDRLLVAMNQRIEVLLDRDHQLGHAYFLPLRKGGDLRTLAGVFRNQVVPLLQEYFFEDWERIAWVLNDHRKADEASFLVQPALDAVSLLGKNVDVPTGAKLWRINEKAFANPESYRGIIEATRD